MEGKEPVAARLNDVADVLAALTVDRLRGVLGGGLEAPLAGCDYNCDCNHSYCTCRGSVSKGMIDRVSFPEFLALREQRVKDLREQLEALDPPAGFRGE